MVTVREERSSAVLGDLLPDVPVAPPGPASRALAERLRRSESRNVTWLGDGSPVFWTEARGANVLDADGNRYLDLTGAFGVALAGHAHPRVVDAVREQTGRLTHGMGDVHPPAPKVELLERLGRLTPWPQARGVLASTGSEAVEIALKTALLATERPGILAFEGGYHGLTLGALATTARPLFRERFEPRLYGGVARAPFPWRRTGRTGRTAGAAGTAETAGTGGAAGAARAGGTVASASVGGAPGDADAALEAVGRLLREGAPGGDPIGAVILEPVQGRAGVRIPPAGFLAAVAELAREHGALVIADEILTGAGRCGAPLASTRLGLEPDLVCLGKALGGGMPLSACLGRAEVMDAWPPSGGEAIHTSTFLGHPVACAAALAVLDLLDEGLAASAERMGEALRQELTSSLRDAPDVAEVRGLGALVGIELRGDGAGAELAVRALGRGLVLLPAGERGEVVELAPSAFLTAEQRTHAVEVLAQLLRGRAA